MSTLVILGLVGILGFACQWFAWRTKQPAILYLLLLGIIAGPLTGVLDPDALFGDLLFPIVSLAVAIILFEGSLTLKRKELEDIGQVVWNMVTFGALIAAAIVTLAAHWLAGLAWPLAALFGAIMVVTGPTVIVPLLRAVRPNVRISRTLRWEGIIIDPLGALFAVLVFEWIVVQQTQADLVQVVVVFFQTVIFGSLIGVATAYPFGLLLRHHWIPEYLHNFAAISFVFAAFVLSESITHESGLLAVTVMGIWLANMKDVNTRGILEFKESLTLIFVSALFILLAARINFASLQQLGWGALAMLVVIQFIARPVKVWLSSMGSNFSTAERIFLAWLGPRGIVAAAVTALFALRLEQLGFEQAELLVPLAFSVIVGTVVLQSLTAKALAKKLGVAQPKATGYLIIGANPVGIALGKALREADSDVILCDIYWDNISKARMAGLPTYYGSPISDHAELHLDISMLGGMLGVSHHQERNLAAALRYKEDFGIRKIFTLASPEESTDNRKKRTSDLYRGRILFNATATYGKLASVIAKGGTVKKTNIGENFSFNDWKTRHAQNKTIPLFAKDNKGQIVWFTAQGDVEPQPGWTIFALAPEDKQTQA